uniref:Uncharacterized protein n=1 Tax=viral metagenome TaxID=1070528 RepID=A0A6M3LSU4_9ZZZZ
MAKYDESASGKVVEGSAKDSLTVSFMANIRKAIVLDSGKRIEPYGIGRKANDIQKAEARKVFDKLKPAERDEVKAFFAEPIRKFLQSKQDFRDFTASASSLGRRIYR